MSEQVVGKAIIRSEVDSSGVDAGVERSKRSLASLGQAGASAGRAVSEGISQIPAAANAAAAGTDKLTAAQARFLSSLERQAAITTQGKAAYLETRAAQLGIADAASKSIAAIRAAEAAQASLGKTAGTTAQQLRQVAPQITDIVTQLSGGQAPLQVLIQQGGQLKDVFGGIGPAARVLGTYVAGLINPFVLGAAALGGFVYAATRGTGELREFQNAATLTGNAVGLSASSFASLRDSLAGVAGTKSAAAAALTEVAASGKIAAANVREVTEAALLMEKATGQAVAKTVAQFAELAGDPVKAAAKLNEGTNFLTASVYAQIKALDEQGRRADAAQVATKAYADVTKERATAVVENVGFIEKAWKNVLAAVKQVVDATADIGRTQTTAQELAFVQGEIAQRRGQDKNRPFAPLFGGESLQDLQDRERRLLRIQEITNGNAAAQADNARVQTASVIAIDAVAAANDRYASKQQQLNKALGDYRRQLADIKAADPNSKLLDPKTVAATERGIRQQFTETTGEDGIAAQRAAKRIADVEIARIQASINTLDFGTPTKLTEAEKKVILVQEQLKGSLLGKARASKEAELAEAQHAVAADRTRTALEKQVEAVKRAVDVTNKQVEAAGEQADSIRQQALEQAAANATFGKGAVAINELRLAQMQATLAQLDASDRADPRYIAALQQKINAQKDFVEQLRITENKTFQVRNRDLGITNADEAQLLQLELSLVGTTSEYRERIVAQRRVELDYARKIAEVDRSDLSPDDKAARRAELAAQQVIASSNAAAKVTVQEWQRASDSINQSLTDALLRGFEAGKGFAENLRDTVSNMFKTLVLSPVIKAVLSPVSGAISGVGQSIGQSIVGGGGSGLSGLGNLGSSLAGLFGGGGADAIGAGLGSLAEQSAINAALGSSTAAAGGALSGLAAAGPYAAAALAAVAIGKSLFSSKGGPRASGYYGPNVEQHADNSLGGGLKTIVDQYDAQLQQFLKIGGSTSTAQLGLSVSTDPRGTAQTHLQNTATVNGAVVYHRWDGNIGRDEASLNAAIDGQIKESFLQALKASDIKGGIADYLSSVDIMSNVQGIYARVTKALTEQADLQEQLFQLTATDDQKSTRARDQLRAATDSTNQALLEQVFQQQDLTKAAEAAKAALADVGAALDSALSSYRTNTTAGIGRGDAFAQIQAALAISKAGGPLPDAAKLKDAISVLSQVDQTTSKSLQEFIQQRDAEAALLAQLKIAYEGVATTPAISAAQAAANQAQTTAATTAALQAMQKQLDEANAIAAAAAESNRKASLILEAVTTGGASFETTAGG